MGHKRQPARLKSCQEMNTPRSMSVPQHASGLAGQLPFQLAVATLPPAREQPAPMSKPLTQRLNALAVSLYKALGLLLLALILTGLVSYLSVQGFFLVSRSWVAPAVVSPTDPEILQLNTQLAQQSAAREALLAQRRELRARREEAQRLVDTERSFQHSFREALRQEHRARAEALRRLGALRSEHSRARQEIAEANQAFSDMARPRADALYQAHLSSWEEHLTARHQLAQMAQVSLGLAQREAELEERHAQLRRELQGLAAALGRRGSERTTQVLLLARELERSRLALARAEVDLQGLEESLAALESAIARYDGLIASIRSSPWMEALERNLTVAFVPYDNLEAARPGQPLYACALSLVWCRPVGLVHRALQGEVKVKHPVRQQLLRGVMVELELPEPGHAREELLHLGGPPLLL